MGRAYRLYGKKHILKSKEFMKAEYRNENKYNQAGMDNAYPNAREQINYTSNPFKSKKFSNKGAVNSNNNNNDFKENIVRKYIDRFQVRVYRPACSYNDLKLIITNKFSGLDNQIKISNTIEANNSVIFNCILSKTVNVSELYKLNLSSNWEIISDRKLFFR